MCKQLIWFVGVVLLLSTIPPASQAQVVNLAPLNSSFEEEDDFFNGDWGGGWVTWNSDAGDGSTITYDDTEFIDGAKSLRLDAKGTVAWDFMVLYVEIPLEVGQKYTVSVWAKAEEARTFVMLCKAMDNSTAWGNTTFDLTEEWAEFAITAEAQNQNGNIKVIIHCAGTEIPMWLDSFYVYEGPYVEGINQPELPVQAKATDPKPETEATDVLRNPVLSWTPGAFAAPTNGHIVYFGENFDDVNDASGGEAQTAASYTPPQRLDLGKTYYWRVDEVDAPPDSTVHKGDVWSFTAEPFAYVIENISATASGSFDTSTGPENTVNNSGLDADDLHSDVQTNMWLTSPVGPQPIWIQYEFDKVYKLHEMWVWNYNQKIESIVGFGLKDVTIEYSTDGTDWTALDGVPEFAKAPGVAGYAHNTTVDFGGAAVKYVKITVHSNWGGLVPQYGLSEVRFLYIPVLATEPSPVSGATNVPLDVTLGFRAGREAAKHDVYLGTDEQAVIDGTVPVTTVTEAGYGPLSLDLGQTYYWRVDEVNEAETPTTWQGDLWDFTTQEYLILEDFEAYDDFEPNRIFDTWTDGWGVATNGSTMGYPDPIFVLDEHFVETTIVHSGSQSTPLFYDNTAGATYSEATRTVDTPRNWTQAGVKVLTLWFYGDPNNSVAGQIYVKLNGTKVVYEGDANVIRRPWWTQWNIDPVALGVNLQNVTTMTIGVDGAGTSGIVYIDDILLYRVAPEPVLPVDPGTENLVAYYSMENNTQDGSGNGYDGGPIGGPTYVQGPDSYGMAMQFDGIDDCVDLGADPVFNFTGSFSLSVWANITTWDINWQHILIGNRGDGGTGWQLRRHSSNRICFTTRGVGSDDTASERDMPLGEWVNIAAVYDNVNNMKHVYINGAQETSVATNEGSLAVGAQNLYIGARATSGNTGPERFFSGSLDEMRIYNRALSTGEVRYLALRP